MKKRNSNNNLVEKIVDFFTNLFHFKISDKTKSLLVQIFKFGIVGAIATIIDFVFLYVFRELIGCSILVSNTLSFSISVIYNYIASIIFVFNVDKNKDSKIVFIKFIIFSIIGLFISNILMELFANIINLHYLIAKIISTLVVMVFNFITRKIFLE